MVDHALAILLANGEARTTGLLPVAVKILKDGDMDIRVDVFKGSGKAATLVTMTKGPGGPPWKLGETRVSVNLTSLTARPFSMSADRDEIAAGETGKIAIVADGKSFESAHGLVDLAVQIFSDDGSRQVMVILDRTLVRR